MTGLILALLALRVDYGHAGGETRTVTDARPIETASVAGGPLVIREHRAGGRDERKRGTQTLAVNLQQGGATP